MFNAKEYFNDTGFSFWESGKNISQGGWIGVQCPFCDDRSNHLGISPDSIRYSCFRCGTKGHIIKLIQKLNTVEYEQAKSIFNKYSTDMVPTEVKYKRITKVEWPKQMLPKLKLPHKKYLKGREFNPRLLQNQFDLRCCMYSGPFKYRILIPVYANQKLMTYIGRDITGKSGLPYKNLGVDKSILSAKECIYNIDNTNGTAIIVEGVTDVWRLGCYGVVATLGLVFTTTQVNKLTSSLKRAYIMYDSEKQAIEKAHELGNLLSMSGVPYIEVLELSSGDPANLTQHEVDKLKKDLLQVKLKRRKL